ncbi:uncharacterized protein DUF5107 [Stackebrandtia albiflava]|uniref:Uncharacterized protein DUF5107 n=1 Tax=Stackebrandtia albiflava TaxID=406432 RepID=A0A562VBR2_9ACTN|nr:DUF5107 domain-containing protein [Stackebrandtia albiflava]TWJ15316.1 uncharacterized protein DUF5107 [Stackebrandtia albiflava]
MTRISLTTLRLPATPVGDPSPLPPLPGTTDPNASVPVEGVPDEVARNMRHGRPASVLPYTTQDGYDRRLRDTVLPVAVIDNGVLRATVVPALGGRLWSLVHLPTGRELLYRNPVLRPANLALRDAWFSGGVEWNIGTTGHTPLTCAPMHAAEVDGPDGPILRLWEYERLREVPYQVDLSLPPGSDRLYVGVRIVNPHTETVPMYWWSNIAVPQRPGGRVIAPADDAYLFSYGRRLHVVPAPVHDGADYSDPAGAPHAADYFFRITAGDRPWIAAVDAAGDGLVQASTARLTGRKLFVWGGNPGGRRWQRWLTEGGGDYLEIQAGLAATQLEHLPMPPGAHWSWVEAYGPVALPPHAAHGDWATARTAVETALDASVPAAELTARHETWPWDAPPARTLTTGSGWGALERHRRRVEGEPETTLPGIPFPDTTDAETAPWRTLLDTGRLPAWDPTRPPVSYATSPAWRRRLEAADLDGDWHGLYQLGLARAAAGETAGAKAAWHHSLSVAETAWAHRALGHLALRTGRAVADPDARREAVATAVQHYERAVAAAPDVWQLTVEACDALFAAGRDANVLRLTEAAGPVTHGQVTMRRLKALIRTGRLDEARSVFDGGFEVPNLREGEETLDSLWFALAERRVAGDGEVTDEVRAEARRRHPLPERYDFRMGVT